jgi:biopolymer transport protein ExbD
MFSKKDGHVEEKDTHGSRPWVYFMIDCFLLMTNFFIISFQFKTQEPILPQKLPPGCGIRLPGYTPPLDTKLLVHVKHVKEGTKEKTVYEYLGRSVTMDELTGVLRDVARGAAKVRVLVSYADNCRWQDVVDIFNQCQRLKIDQCGLVPSRSVAAGRK